MTATTYDSQLVTVGTVVGLQSFSSELLDVYTGKVTGVNLDGTAMAVINGLTVGITSAGKVASVHPTNSWSEENLIPGTTQLYIITDTISYNRGNTQHMTRAGGAEIDINNLTPRDRFAAATLNAMLQHVDNPEACSDTEITTIVRKAYRWAQGLMEAAADARNTSASSTTISDSFDINKVYPGAIVSLQSNLANLAKNTGLVTDVAIGSEMTFKAVIDGITIYADDEGQVIGTLPTGKLATGTQLYTPDRTLGDAYGSTLGTITINSLSPRDEFALQTLNALVDNKRMDIKASDTEISFHTKAAYRWAQAMMNAAADARSELPAGQTVGDEDNDASFATQQWVLSQNYLSNASIPDELADLTDDATHRLVTDTEKAAWNAKQAALVSGTNIKTVNNQSILGSGNITIQAGDTQIQSDWNQTNSSLKDYIKNKPTNLALIGDTQGSDTIANFDPQTDTVHVTAQTLSSSAKTQARTNISAVGSSDVTQIVKLTQAAYDLITPNSNTLYVIVSS